MSDRPTDSSMFPHDCRDLIYLTNINIAVASNTTFASGPRNTTSDSESDQRLRSGTLMAVFGHTSEMKPRATMTPRAIIGWSALIFVRLRVPAISYLDDCESHVSAISSWQPTCAIQGLYSWYVVSIKAPLGPRVVATGSI
jgi:hypothetical protein